MHKLYVRNSDILLKLRLFFNVICLIQVTYNIVLCKLQFYLFIIYSFIRYNLFIRFCISKYHEVSYGSIISPK